MTEALIASVKQEAIFSDAPQASLASVKQEAIYEHLAPSVLVANVKQEVLNVYVTQRVKIAEVKQEVLVSNIQVIPPAPLPPPRPKPNLYHPLDIPCIPAPRSRFRRFWATQPNVCPPDPGVCNTECEQPGLSLLITRDPTWKQFGVAYDGKGGLPDDCAAPITGASISTENYVRGLIINILGTNAAQSSSKCGNQPGQRLGYWLDSISGDKSGSSIRYVPTTGFNTAQSVQFVQMQAQADLQKLITYGVANTVTVTASYIGGGSIGLKIVVAGTDDTTTVVNSTVTKISNAWVWNSP